MASSLPGDRAPLALALGLGALTAISRFPLRSRYLFAWDSANFALALNQYNVAFHQPQPPGYPLYVGAANVARLLTREANAAFVLLSILASGLAVTFLLLAAYRLYGRRTATLGAILLATSSVFWSQGEVAYPYAFLACFSALVGWLALLIRDGAPGWVVGTTGLTIGLAAGFRSELLPFLAPLWLYAAWRRRLPIARRVREIAVGLVLMGLAVVSWYVPMVQLSGGWAAYQAATGSYYTYFIQTTSGAGKLLLGLLENTRALVGFLYNGLGLALVPMVYFIGRYFTPPRLVTDQRARFVTLWLLPPLVFYVTVHIGNPGYVLSFLPALCVFGAEAVLGTLEDVREAGAALGKALTTGGEGSNRSDSRAGSSTNASTSPGTRAGLAFGASLVRTVSRVADLVTGSHWVVPAAWVLVLGIGLTNALLFRFGNGEGRYPEIRQIDRIFERQLAEIQARYPAQSTVIVAYDRSRQYRYYLPQHEIKLLFDVAVAGAVTDTSRYWERRTVYQVPAGKMAVLFPDLDRNTSDQPGLVQEVDLGLGVKMHVAQVRAGDEVRYGYQYASARPAAGG